MSDKLCHSRLSSSLCVHSVFMSTSIKSLRDSNTKTMTYAHSAIVWSHLVSIAEGWVVLCDVESSLEPTPHLLYYLSDYSVLAPLLLVILFTLVSSFILPILMMFSVTTRVNLSTIADFISFSTHYCFIWNSWKPFMPFYTHSWQLHLHLSEQDEEQQR